MNFIENLLSQRNAKITKDIRVLGIDLGTTNSTVAEVILKPNESPQCRTIEIDQPTREGLFTSPLVPSVVAIHPDKKVWIGEGAKRLRAFSQESNLQHEKNLFYETKNEMGIQRPPFSISRQRAPLCQRVRVPPLNLSLNGPSSSLSFTMAFHSSAQKES